MPTEMYEFAGVACRVVSSRYTGAVVAGGRNPVSGHPAIDIGDCCRFGERSGRSSAKERDYTRARRTRAE